MSVDYTLKVYDCLRCAISLLPDDAPDNPDPKLLKQFSVRLAELREKLSAACPASNSVMLDDYAVVHTRIPRSLLRIGQVSFHDAALWWAFTYYKAITEEINCSGLEAAERLYKTFPKPVLATYQSLLQREQILASRNTGDSQTSRQPINTTVQPLVAGAVDGEGNSRAAILAKMQPANRKAYLAYLYAESKAGKRLEDRAAYDWLKENGIDADKGDVGELVDYKMPSFNTWTKQLRNARNPLGEQKYTRRAKRSHGKSIVGGSEIEYRG